MIWPTDQKLKSTATSHKSFVVKQNGNFILCNANEYVLPGEMKLVELILNPAD